MDIGVDRALKNGASRQEEKRKTSNKVHRCRKGSYVEQPLKAAVKRRRSRRRTTKKRSGHNNIKKTMHAIISANV